MNLVGQRAQVVYAERDRLKAENAALRLRLAKASSLKMRRPAASVLKVVVYRPGGADKTNVSQQVPTVQDGVKAEIDDVLEEMSCLMKSKECEIAELERVNCGLVAEVKALTAENKLRANEFVKVSSELNEVTNAGVAMKENLSKVAAECVSLYLLRKEFGAEVAKRLSGLDEFAATLVASKTDTKKARKAAKHLEDLEAEVSSLRHMIKSAEARAKKAEIQAAQSTERAKKSDTTASVLKAEVFQADDRLRLLSLASDAAQSDIQMDVRMMHVEMETVKLENERLRVSLGEKPVEPALAKLHDTNMKLVQRVLKAERDNKKLRSSVFSRIQASDALVHSNVISEIIRDDDE
jgi:regulator of replication initiation timing